MKALEYSQNALKVVGLLEEPGSPLLARTNFARRSFFIFTSSLLIIPIVSLD